MKYLFTLFALITSINFLSAQNVSTSPVGYRTDTIPAGNMPYAPSFVHADAFAGTISGLAESGGNTVVSLAGAALTTSTYDEGSNFPAYYLEITESGSSEGYSFDIISNTADSVTVKGLLSSSFSLAGTENVVVRKHMTIGDIFSGSTASLTSYSDSVKIFNSDNTITLLYWDGSVWTPDFANDRSLKPIYPGRGFLTSFAGSVELTVDGNVKTTKTKVPVYAGQVNLIGTLAPSDTDIDGFNAITTLQAYSDSIKVVSLDGTFSTQGTYYTDGSQMTRDFSSDHGTESIEGHSSALLSAGSNFYLTLPAAYP